MSIPTVANEGFAVDVNALVSAITPATRVLLLNTPGNPSGNVMSEEELSYLAEVTHDQDIWLVCDEVHSMLSFDKPHISARRVRKA